MPKSKRNKVVHLTQVKKKGKDHKDELLKQLEENFDKYQFVYVFDFDQTKADRIMELRLKVKGTGRVFAGRNSLVSQALRAIGTRTETNYDKFLHHIKGHRGLLFTDVERNEMISMLESQLKEFLGKLLGYAQLKTPDDDTAGRASDSGGDDDDGGAAGDAEPAEDGVAREKCVSFRPIKLRKKKQRQSSAPLAVSAE